MYLTYILFMYWTEQSAEFDISFRYPESSYFSHRTFGAYHMAFKTSFISHVHIIAHIAHKWISSPDYSRKTIRLYLFLISFLFPLDPIWLSQIHSLFTWIPFTMYIWNACKIHSTMFITIILACFSSSSTYITSSLAKYPKNP